MCGIIQQLQGIKSSGIYLLVGTFPESPDFRKTNLPQYSIENLFCHSQGTFFFLCVCIEYPNDHNKPSLIKPYCDLYNQATSLEQPAANWPNLGEIARCSQVTSLLQLIGCQTGCSRSLKCLQHDQGTAFFPDTAMCSWKEDTLPRHFLCVPHFVVGPVGICTLQAVDTSMVGNEDQRA